MMHNIMSRRNRNPFHHRDWEGEKYIRSVLTSLKSLRWILKGNSDGIKMAEFASGLEKVIEVIDHCPKPFGPLDEEPTGAILYVKTGFARSLSSLMQTLIHMQTENQSPAGVPWLDKWHSFREDAGNLLKLATDYGSNKDARAPGWTEDDPLDLIKAATKDNDFVLKIIEEWQVKLNWER